MAIVVNETDELKFILTQYGINRIAEALESPTVKLNISKIKVGDANGEYYEPVVSATELVHQITNGSFYITDKELLEDNLTVSFRAIIPESFSNCEIREVGIYETVNGEDFLFALSTQQPLLKPSTDLGYLISVDYYAFLKSQNLADAYEQIILDPDNQLVTQDKLDDLMSTILFTESNLMEQVNTNTRIIGYNRNQQLYDLITEEQKNFGYVATYNNCATLLNFVDSSNLYAYWIFDYPRRVASSAEIVDIGPSGRNLSTNVSVNNYVRTYQGFASFLDFSTPNYYYMNQSSQELVYSSNDFTLVPILNNNIQISKDGVAYGFTTSDYITTSNLDTSKDFQITMLYRVGTSSEGNPQNPLLSDSNGIVEILAREDNTIGANITNSDGTQVQLTSSLKVNDNVWRYIRLSKTGTTLKLENSLDASTWSSLAKETLTIKAGTSITYIGRNSNGINTFSGFLGLKYFSMIVGGVQVASGGRYEVANELTFLNSDHTEDAPITIAFTVEPASTESKRTLLARSNYSSGSHYFEINETANNSVEIILFADSSNYITFTTGEGTVPSGAHTLLLSYDSSNKTMDIYINGKSVKVTKVVTGTYSHMNDRPSELYAFSCLTDRIKYADSPTAPTKLLDEDGSPNIDSNWGIQGTNIFYSSNITTYTASYNKETSGLLAWTASGEYVFTKSSTIAKDTLLYNSDYTFNSKFKVVQSGENYIIEYNDVVATRDSSSDIAKATLYAFLYSGNLETIWANSSTIPSSLYYYNGDIYNGEDWTISDSKVYWKDIEASYSSQYNRTIPSVPVTSYVTGADGSPIQLVNSKIASALIIKELLTDDELRSLALLLEATRGQNPCIYVS